MFTLFVAMFFILVLAGAVAVYVAFPHRGQDVPHVPWLGQAMRKGVDALPTLDNQAGHRDQHAGPVTSGSGSSRP